jgi:hypothetical protein
MNNSNEVNLEVAFDRDRDQWVIRPFGGDGVKTFANYDTMDEAVKTAGILAGVFASYINIDGSCEVHTRRLDGTLGDPDTYGHDPESSVG